MFLEAPKLRLILLLYIRGYSIIFTTQKLQICFFFIFFLQHGCFCRQLYKQICICFTFQKIFLKCEANIYFFTSQLIIIILHIQMYTTQDMYIFTCRKCIGQIYTRMFYEYICRSVGVCIFVYCFTYIYAYVIYTHSVYIIYTNWGNLQVLLC